MKYQEIVRLILKHDTLVALPPVLVDIGASGALPAQWEWIASSSVCIAFDPDEREMAFIEKEKSQFGKLVVVNRIVLPSDDKETDFYLTASPFCSSVLQPDSEALAPWQFADLFRVERRAKLKAVKLLTALKEAGIQHIDWFKTDTQGIDLRLFQSLGSMQERVLVMDCEPGFIDAYKGEDKIADTLAYMSSMPFWISSVHTKGTKRLNEKHLKEEFSQSELAGLAGDTVDSSCWAEMTFVNDFRSDSQFGVRECLLGCVFSIVLKQYAFAAELAMKGRSKFDDKMFDTVIAALKEAGGSETTSPAGQSLIQRGLRGVARRLNRLAE